MKKLFVMLMVFVALFSFVSCASSNNVVSEAEDAWWDNPPADTEEYHYEIGTAKHTSNQIARNWAKADGNKNIAQYVQNTVEAVVETMASTGGELFDDGSVNDQTLQAYKEASLQRANAVLKGVTYKYHTMEDGTVFVLAQLPINAFAEELTKQLDESFVENKAYRAAQDEMKDTIHDLILNR